MKQLKVIVKDLRKEVPKDLMEKYEKEFLASKVKHEKEDATALQLKRDPDEDFLLLSEKPSKMPKAKTKREVLTPIIVGPRHKTKFSRFQCTICLKYFGDKQWLKEHIELHYQPLNSECKKCKKVFPHKAYLTKHVCRSSTCPHCNKTLMHANSLKLHIRKVHGLQWDDKAFVCDYCGTTCRFKRVLERHLKACSSKQKQKFICDHCGLKFTLKCRLGSHVQHHAIYNVQCKICKKEIRPKNMQMHIRYSHPQKKEKLQCKKCPKTFISLQAFKVHCNRHEKCFKCSFCPKEFRANGELKVHMELHENPDKYKCHICGHRTTRKSDLKIHLETHNKNREKNLKCDRCDYKTHNGGAYKIHLGYHKRMDEKLKKFPNAIKCKKCPAVVKTMISYQEHLKKKHGNNKKFECNLCEKSYIYKNDLKVHYKKKHEKNK